MSIIMRSSGQKREQVDKRKQLYTWVGCGLVGVLTLISVIPNRGAEPQAPDYSKFSSSKMQDLAAMPFGTDAEAYGFLQANPEYEEISNEDLLGSLFSSEDRKERQAQDKAEGVPPPPDPEYKEIAKQKEKEEEAEMIKEARIQRQKRDNEDYSKRKKEVAKKEQERAAKAAKKKNEKNVKQNQQQVRNQNTRTTPGTLASSSGRSGSSSGSSGVTGSIWRYEGKDIKGANTVADHVASAQDVAFAKDKGRNVGLDVAAIESMKGANAASAEGAAAGAIDAFQGEVEAEDLAKDEEELGLDELPEGLNADLQDDVKRQLNDDIKNQTTTPSSPTSPGGKEYSINENCMDSNGHRVNACLWNKFWLKLMDAGINIVTDFAGNVLTGVTNSWFPKG